MLPSRLDLVASGRVELMSVRLGSADYQKTITLRQAVLLEPFGIPLIAAQADDQRAVHLAAFQAESCVGCLLLIDRGGGTWQLRQMAVTPELQRQGIGQKLVSFAVDWAREAGGTRLMAHAREPAVPFYERAGFSVERDPYIQVGLPHRTVALRL
jgi:GNAT superfamily N-acetyltransferase